MSLEPTELDRAFEAMSAPNAGETGRLRYFEVLSTSELFLFLNDEAPGNELHPRTFELEDGTFLLAFDREDRLAEFAGGPAPYAALSGRAIAALASPEHLGLGVNLSVAASEMLLPPEALIWLTEMLSAGPSEDTDGIRQVGPPVGPTNEFLDALGRKLERCSGLAPCAYLATADYTSGRTGLALFVPGAHAEVRSALASAISEIATFGGDDAIPFDVAFLDQDSPLLPRLEEFGLRIDIPVPEAKTRSAQTPPGSDPDTPPILR